MRSYSLHSSSLRRQGPITKNVCGYAGLGLQLVAKLDSVAMGPRVRGDNDNLEST
jgi:hypothetical protein